MEQKYSLLLIVAALLTYAKAAKPNISNSALHLEDSSIMASYYGFSKVTSVADLSKVPRTTKRLEILTEEHAAADVALLPSETLEHLYTRKLSLRWSSAKQVFFPNLRTLIMSEGDFNIKLFKFEKIESLYLENVHLWDSKLENLNDSMPSLRRLEYICSYSSEVCQDNLNLDLLQLKHLEFLRLRHIEVDAEETKLSPLTMLGRLELTGCVISHAIKREFNSIFPNLFKFNVTINEMNYFFLNKILKAQIPELEVEVPIATPSRTISYFVKNIKDLTNLTLEEGKLRGKTITFHEEQIRRNFTFHNNSELTWRYSENEIYRSSRIFNILDTFIPLWLTELNTAHPDTQSILDTIYFAYTTFVYFFCIFGITCNLLSAIVLVQPSMRSSPGYIMVSLAFYDTLFLITSLFTLEEFQLLFEQKEVRSAWNSYFAYPMNKTVYLASIYTTVLITVERFFAIRYPLRVATIFTTTNSLRCVIAVLLFSISLNISRWFEFMRYEYAASSPIWSRVWPKQLNKMKWYYTGYHRIIWNVFVYAVPLITIAVLNFINWAEVRNRRKERRQLGVFRRTPDHSLTKILLLIVFICFFCNLIGGTINWIFLSKGHEPEIAEIFSSLPIVLNCSINFILYHFMGEKFRIEFKRVIISTLYCRPIESSTTNARTGSTVYELGDQAS